MSKVYIVCETIDGEMSIGGVYKTYKKAREHAKDIAEYGGVEEGQRDFWGDDEYNCITIEVSKLI